MSLRLRPRFEIQLEASTDEVMDRLGAALAADGASVLGHRYVHQYELYVPEPDRHFWSPFLNLLFYEDGGSTRIEGRFGPNVNVWTLFLALYAVLGLSGCVGLVIAWSQYTIGQSSSGFVLVGACMILSLVVWIAGKVGESLAGPQIEHIKEFVEGSLDVEITIN